jgi:homeobox protein cut-like
VGSANAPPNKKQRVLFSEEQKEALKLAFALDPYPNVQTIEFLANELNLSTRTITNWFHNHRMRLKQQVPHSAPSEPIPSRENSSGQPFDPVQFRVLLNQRLMDIQKERMGLSGVPLPYPPYFANPQLAALIRGGLLPGDVDLAALNNAMKEQMSGLDLSMTNSFKREGDDDFDDDNDMSDNESMDGDKKRGDEDDHNPQHPLAAQLQALSRTSRRKPAAPQWVNPDWQEGKSANIPSGNKKDDEIINGVCVMQQADVQQRLAAAMAAVAAMAAHNNKQQTEDENQNSDNEDNDDSNKSVHSNEAECDDETGKKSPATVKKELDDEADRWEY